MQALIDRLAESGATSPQALVDAALDFAGPLQASETTRAALLEAAEADGDLAFDSDEARDKAATRAAQALRLVIASPEYQFA